MPSWALVILAVISLSACRENTLIDSGISPTDNTIGIYDTSLDVMTRTYFDDTVLTGLYISGLSVTQAIGSFQDPFFGTLTASSYFQVVPVNPSPAVFTNKTIDSAVLIVPYSYYSFGDTSDQNSRQSYQVYYTSDNLDKSSVRYSNTVVPVDEGNPLSEVFTANLHQIKDSITVAGSKKAPCLRIPLKKSVLESRLLPALTNAGNNPTDPNNSFHSVFKGLCVRPADSRTTTSIMPYFRLDGSTEYTTAGIIVYYHTNGGNDTLTQRYYFDGSACGFYNQLKRTYSHSPVNALYTSTSPNDSIIGIQNQPGASLDVYIPGITKLPKGEILKAELQLSMLPTRNDTKYDPVSRLYPMRIANGTYPAGEIAGSENYVMDRYPLNSLTPLSILNGQMRTFDRNGTSVKTYVIGLPREITASYKANNDTLHLHITGTADYVGAYRALLGGGSHPNSLYKAKLFVVYSRLN